LFLGGRDEGSIVTHKTNIEDIYVCCISNPV
jgi:hypothetical protein